MSDKQIEISKGLFQYEIEFFRPIEPHAFLKNEPISLTMARQNFDELEHAILKAPELWMWQHRRFKQIRNL